MNVDMDALKAKHWLKFDKRQITGCQCGFPADTDSDCGYGDSVANHLMEVGAAEGQAERDALAELLAAARHRHRPYPNAQSPHAYCLNCLTGRKSVDSNFPEYVKWPCPEAIDLGMAEGGAA